MDDEVVGYTVGKGVSSIRNSHSTADREQRKGRKHIKEDFEIHLSAIEQSLAGAKERAPFVAEDYRKSTRRE